MDGWFYRIFHKSGKNPYTNVVNSFSFDGVQAHFYRKPKRFGGLKNPDDKVETGRDRFLSSQTGDANCVSRNFLDFSLLEVFAFQSGAGLAGDGKLEWKSDQLSLLRQDSVFGHLRRDKASDSGGGRVPRLWEQEGLGMGKGRSLLRETQRYLCRQCGFRFSQQ